jgi:pyrimidine operon attenuation protein / uracil phosphoribosyltransferase
MRQEREPLLDQQDIARTITRMAHEVVEKTAAPNEIVIVGIRSRGVHLARRMARKIEEFTTVAPPIGVIDVTRYRDDQPQREISSKLPPLEVPIGVDDRTVVLVDDVIFRGRTIRAAMQRINQLGQPRRILLAVLIDRGARELPFRADIVGRNIEAEDSARVNVLLEESDGIDQVILSSWGNR